MKNPKAPYPVIILDFSGISPHLADAEFLDCTDLTGTNCYCDGEAFAAIQSRIAQAPVAGIHLIDSGNYHYLSRIWLEKISEPFQLVMLDNHTDLQPPAFGGLLSCGGWLLSSLTELPLLRKCFLIGPDQESFDAVQEELGESRLTFYSRETLASGRVSGSAVRPCLEQILQAADPRLPLYLSIDLDILCPSYATTTWSQGDLTLPELCEILAGLKDWCYEHQVPLLGADLCGAADPDSSDSNDLNIAAHEALLRVLQE